MPISGSRRLGIAVRGSSRHERTHDRVMKFISTRGGEPVSFRDALFRGLAVDGGLYMPERIEPLNPMMLQALRGAPLPEIGAAVAGPYLDAEIDRATLIEVLGSALNFPIVLRPVDDGLSALELFHGPTFAFKDVGARVMARLMSHFYSGRDPLTVLVATSGDTGSAVAQAFFGVPGTRVVVLFPNGQVTPVQEAQFSTLGGNVTAIAIDGTFDDCQRLAKQAFSDRELCDRARLTSANSINIGRLLPQAFYYVSAALQFLDGPAPVFSVPSGNFGNLTAGVIAARMGAPIAQFVAATTVNDTVPRYLASGLYEPRPSVTTVANAMDVGDPSNAERLRWLFEDDHDAMRSVLQPSVHADADVRTAIRTLYARTGYVCDPHSAIAYLGSQARVAKASSGTQAPVVFLATAHPAKFREVVEPAIGKAVDLPPALADALTRERHVTRMRPELRELRDVLA
jgi:threonine synthase